MRRDRAVGGSLLAVAGVVVVLNFIMEVAPSVVLLPGGHSEAYFVVGIAVVIYGAWITFDLGDKRHRRR